MQIATTDLATTRALPGPAATSRPPRTLPWALERTDAVAARRLSGVQAARGVAALAVVATHAISHPMKEQGGILGVPGLYGVTLFFVISGYIMVRTTGDGTFSARTFLDRRLRRIVPLYYLACATLALAALVLPYSFRTTTIDGWHIVKSLLFVPAYAPKAPDEILPFYKLGWTLNQEMFFYVSFAALASLGVRGRVWMLTVLFSLLVAAGRLLTIGPAIPRFYTYPIIIAFVAGMWLARIRLAPDTRLSAPLAWMLLGVSVLSLAGLAAQHQLFVTHELAFILWLTATATVQMLVTILFIDRGGVAVPRWMAGAGDASYSLYLFHMFGIGFGLVVMNRLAPGQLPLAIAAAAAMAVAFGVVVHRLIEAPLMRWLTPRQPSTTSRVDVAAA